MDFYEKRHREELSKLKTRPGRKNPARRWSNFQRNPTEFGEFVTQKISALYRSVWAGYQLLDTTLI